MTVIFYLLLVILGGAPFSWLWLLIAILLWLVF